MRNIPEYHAPRTLSSGREECASTIERYGSWRLARHPRDLVRPHTLWSPSKISPRCPLLLTQKHECLSFSSFSKTIQASLLPFFLFFFSSFISRPPVLMSTSNSTLFTFVIIYYILAVFIGHSFVNFKLYSLYFPNGLTRY